MLALAADSFRTERASLIQTIKVFQGMDPDIVWKAKASENAVLYYLLKTAPIRSSGWWDQDRVVYCRDRQKQIDAIDSRDGMLHIAAFPSHRIMDDWNRVDETSIWDAIYTPMSAEVRPFVDNMGLKIAKAETYRRLARLACRLEEYRIAHGQYPDKLDELPDLPAHLNQEVLSEEPLRYQRKGDGYLLYSIGWNQKDDGGVLAKDDKEGDWVWPSP
jgi:hypothetical protein